MRCEPRATHWQLRYRRGVTRTSARSDRAVAALRFVEGLQRRFVEKLERVSERDGSSVRFAHTDWDRDGGRHGGGHRYGVGDTPVFNRASVNVSQVHYDDDDSKRLGSATALSTIIHPKNPHAASVHIHVSWTEMRDKAGYWRMMADLNPAIVATAPKAEFQAALREAAGQYYEAGRQQGDRYFTIPALDRHRGVAHFYLEGHATGEAHADAELARRIGEAAVDVYCTTLAASLRAHPSPSDADRRAQLAYHSVYLLQVLTLDRGTTSGLLVHNQNDVGTLGSLPSHVDRSLLASWRHKLPPPQDQLLAQLVDVLPDLTPSPVTTEVKRALAQTVRVHYQMHPDALLLQASGNEIPPTVHNHR